MSSCEGRDDEVVPHDTVLRIDELRSVHPELIPRYSNEARSQLHIAAIAASMTQDGWRGQPLFVTAPDTAGGLHQAWMGMHRLLAARRVGILGIPVVVATLAQLRDEARFTDAEIRHEAPWIWRSKLEQLRDPRPHRLMLLEAINQPKRGW